MKKIVKLCLSLLVAASLIGCSSKPAEPKTDEIEGTANPSTGIKVAIVLSTGGLGDKNFNDMAYDGLKQAEADFGITFDYVEPASASDFEAAHRQFADSGNYDLIIGLASDQEDAIKAVATDYPDQKFSLVDSSLEFPNVSTVSTKWQEQTFLCGVYAGLATLSDMPNANADNVVGVILGMDNPNLRKGVVGYEAGVRYVNPDAKIIEAVVGNFNDANKGKEIAMSMYNQGADFIQHIAGASGLGVFTAAKEANRYAFGVGGNQNAIEPDYIAATSIRNVNEMVYNEVKSLVEGTWQEGLKVSGLKEDAVGYSNENSNVVPTEEIAAAIEEIKAKIQSGELVICETAEELDAWVEANQYNK
ncbi:MAG: BMP family ABC transporter substrate-binding protein [Anaerorhabdus sp.]|uniref:BMP family ABC transporter substrate-binding protein n=1 Tax=Anaerorhabdus sp. TaxID=1872524 RepID=UPI003A840EDC